MYHAHVKCSYVMSPVLLCSEPSGSHSKERPKGDKSVGLRKVSVETEEYDLVK